MLLLIALANAHLFLDAPSLIGTYPFDAGALDRAATWGLVTFVDFRAYPLFALLFGYGAAQVVRRHLALGTRRVRRLLWRRGVTLLALGFLHAILLFVGDALAAYGLLLLFGGFAVFWRDRWIVTRAVVLFVLISLISVLPVGGKTVAMGDAYLPPDLAAAIDARLFEQPLVMIGSALMFASPFLIGLWAGRRRLLERPQEHPPAPARRRRHRDRDWRARRAALRPACDGKRRPSA